MEGRDPALPLALCHWSVPFCPCDVSLMACGPALELDGKANGASTPAGLWISTVAVVAMRTLLKPMAFAKPNLTLRGGTMTLMREVDVFTHVVKSLSSSGS